MSASNAFGFGRFHTQIAYMEAFGIVWALHPVTGTCVHAASCTLDLKMVAEGFAVFCQRAVIRDVGASAVRGPSPVIQGIPRLGFIMY
jgi:hypothetical protein